MTNIKGTLEKLGLTGKETNTLLSLYALKKATVAELARKSGVPRTTVYTALAKLLEKQMVLRAKVGKRERWEAIAPQRLLAMKQEQVSKLKNIIPELEQLSTIAKSADKSKVVQYSGTKGVQRVYDMVLELQKGERVLGFEGGRSSEKKLSMLPHAYSEGWQAAVKRKGIVLEVVVSEKLLDVINNASIEMLTATRGRATIIYTLPDEVMDFDSDILVFGQHIAIITPKNRTAVVITDLVTSAAFKQLIKVSCLMGKKIDLNAHIAQAISNLKVLKSN